jgi:hypothetical protein
MEYVSASIALFAALIGIIGNTWAPSAKGIRRITTTGWCVLVIASIACLVSVIQATQRQAELEHVERNREQLTTLARGEINRALFYTEDAVRLLYVDYSSHNKRAKAFDWENPGFMLFLEKLPLTSTFMDGEQTWGHFVTAELLRTHAGLTSALNIYGPYLNAETIIAIENMRSCELFQLLLESDRLYPAPTAVMSQRSSLLSLDYYAPLASAYKELRRLIPPEPSTGDH